MGSYYLSEVKPEYYNSIKEYQKQMFLDGSSFDGCQSLDKYDDIEKWHLNNKLIENKDTIPPGYSIAYEYLFMEDNEVVGMINIRPEALNHKYLKDYGGHIGYSIKPSKRRLGIGTKMLKEGLKVCKDRLNLDKVLITCNKNNEGSRKIILNNNGKYESDIFYPPEDKYLERYWIYL